jgi:hypothetical protein
MSHPARMPRSIRLTQQADTVAGCEDCLGDQLTVIRSRGAS